MPEGQDGGVGEPLAHQPGQKREVVVVDQHSL
jgi:hypothetical protein